jgi:hypothetical protein
MNTPTGKTGMVANTDSALKNQLANFSAAGFARSGSQGNKAIDSSGRSMPQHLKRLVQKQSTLTNVVDPTGRGESYSRSKTSAVPSAPVKAHASHSQSGSKTRVFI